MSDHEDRRENAADDKQQTHRGDSFTEEFKVSGEAVVSKIKELVREGNVRRIIIKNDEGNTLIEIPLTIGVIGTVLLPVWAAIGAIAALAANLTIAVERRGATEKHPDHDPPAPAASSEGSGTPQLPR
jgi:hypothetical protein